MHFIRTQGLKITTDRVLLENASLTFSGRTGIVGDNGSGKSTLLRALAADPRVQRSAPVSLLTQQHMKSGTVADYLGVSHTLDILQRCERGEALPEELELEPEDWTLRERLASAFERAGLRIHAARMLSTLSGGELARLGIAALSLRPRDSLAR
jgi:ATPase subunit of ABC transporter with duplicated ATPase domains